MAQKALTPAQKRQFDKALREFATWHGSPFEKDNTLKVREDMNFRDMGFDSLDYVEFIMDMERIFDCAIPDDEVDQIKTVGDACKVLANCIRS